MIAKTNDNLYLAAGGVVLLGSCIWAFLQQSGIERLSEVITAPASGVAYEPAPVALTTAESRQWAGPSSQPAGETWLFDVFTPPVIYYNTDTKKFTVTVPVPRKAEDPIQVVDTSMPAPYGLELVGVEQPLYRLQLVGYIGEGANARGNFLNVLTGEVIFGVKGKKLPSLNLEIVSFSAERVKTKVDGGTEIIETIAKAVVRDTVTGEEIPLDAKIRRPEGPLMATFKKVDGSTVSGKAGDVIALDGHVFVVGSLTSSPPSAVVTKSGGDLAQPEATTLVIPPPVTGPSETAGSMESQTVVSPPDALSF
jgi:hypothetical protein